MLMPWRDIVGPRTAHFKPGGATLRRSLALAGPPPRPQAGSAVIQTPEKSGLPLASRGVAADKSTSPLAVRGAPGVGYFAHCAINRTAAAALSKCVIRRSRWANSTTDEL